MATFTVTIEGTGYWVARRDDKVLGKAKKLKRLYELFGTDNVRYSKD
jgi:hypothetical protein